MSIILFPNAIFRRYCFMLARLCLQTPFNVFNIQFLNPISSPCFQTTMFRMYDCNEQGADYVFNLRRVFPIYFFYQHKSICMLWKFCSTYLLFNLNNNGVNHIIQRKSVFLKKEHVTKLLKNSILNWSRLHLS